MKQIKYYLLALLTALAFFINSEKIFDNSVTIKNIFNNGIIVVVIVLLLLYFFYKNSRNNRVHIFKKLLSIFFAIMIVLGNSFIKLDSWDLIFGNIKMFAIGIISIFGYAFFFVTCFKYLDNYIDKLKEKDINNSKKKRINKFLLFFDNKPILSSLIVLIIFWGIYFIAFYPVILSPDPNYQILQYFGVPTKYLIYTTDYVSTITNHHPVFQTLLLGKCIEIGRSLINDNFGLFLYTFLQASTLGLVLAYTIRILKKYKVSIVIRIIILSIYAIVPMFGFYAISAVKDTFYTAFIILYLIFIFEYIKNKEMNIKKIIYLIFILLMISLFRNNGYYLVLLSMPFIVLYNKKHMIKLLLTFALFIGIYTSYTKILLPYYHISGSGIQEMLSIPFQQTARYVRDHEEELSYEDKQNIDKLLGYDNLVSRYNPNLSDPVKNYYNINSTNEDISNYFETWFNGLINHPGTYIEATMNNVYGYLTPNSTKWYIHTTYKPVKEGNGQVISDRNDLVTDHWPSIEKVVDYNFNNLSGLRKILKGYGEAFIYIPLIGLLSNIGWNTWLALILTAYLISSKNKKYIIVLIPLYVSILVCLAGPVNTYFRYAMPWIFSMPLLIPLLLKEIKKM